MDQWWAGSDPVGQQTAKMTVPTLIADCTVDRLDLQANSHALTGLIPGAKCLGQPGRPPEPAAGSKGVSCCPAAIGAGGQLPYRSAKGTR